METAIDFFARKLQKINENWCVFFAFKLNVSWIKLLVARRHLYMGMKNVDKVSGKMNLIFIL